MKSKVLVINLLYILMRVRSLRTFRINTCMRIVADKIGTPDEIEKPN